MKTQLISIGAVLLMAAAHGSTMTAQRSQSTPPTAQKPGQRVAKAAAAPGQVVLVGCVELESDYRKRMSAGRGGALGTGAGAGDEFVITNVRPASGEVGTSGSRKPDAPGAGSGGGIYTLTGSQEKNLKREVGRQIEVVGKLETAGKESTGAELKDISDLPRINIDTWHPVRDYCPGS